MSGIAELLQKAVLLVAAVDTLKAEVKRMNELLMDQHDRLVRLENGTELIAEKAKNAALGAVNTTTLQIAKDVYDLRAQVLAQKNDENATPQMRSTPDKPLQLHDKRDAG